MADLTQADLVMFASMGISSELLHRAGVERVDDHTAREKYCITGHGDMSGVIFKYCDPLTGIRHTCRLRCDHPDIEAGKESRKYICPYGDRRHLYFVPGCAELVGDFTVVIVLVESEKSALALTGWSARNQRKLLPVALGGCWGWRGRVGKVVAIDGHHVDEKAALPELRICANRDVIVMLDANADTNPAVRAARAALVRELLSMGARVRIATVPVMDAVNGPDDLVAVGGDEALRQVLELARPAAKVAIAEAEAAIAAVKAARPNASTELMRHALDAVADVPDKFQREVLEGRLAAAVRGVLLKKTIVDELADRRERRQQQQAEFADQARITALREHPEDAEALLRDIEGFCRRFYIMSEPQYAIVPVWVLHTYVFQHFDFSPILHIRSSTKRCGKTNVMLGLQRLVWKAWGTGNTSVAALARKAEQGCTLLLDESDSAFKGAVEYREALRGILNVRFSRDGTYSRCVDEGGKLEVKDFHVYGPTAIAGIGSLPDTVTDRSIPLVMRRKGPREAAEPFRHRNVRPAVCGLAGRIERWAYQAADRLIGAEPALIEELNDRAWDICEPLMAIAELVGGDWPARLRRALLEIYSSDVVQDDDLGIQLLQDVKAIFDDHEGDKISSTDLIARLKLLETSPWSDWANGKGLSVHGLSRLLRNFDISPRTIRTGNETAKGYVKESFTHAWNRYLPPSTPGSKASQPSQPAIDAGLGPFLGPSQKPSVTDAKIASEPLFTQGVTDVYGCKWG